MPLNRRGILGILFFCLPAVSAQGREFCAEVLSPRPTTTLVAELQRLVAEHPYRRKPSERRAAEELFDLGSQRLLRATGVNFEVQVMNGNDALVFSPHGTAELNRFSAEMAQKYDALVVFAPQSFLREDAAAFVDVFQGVDQMPRPILGLGGDHVLHEGGSKFRRDLILSHERQHLAFSRDLRTGADSPFHGMIHNEDGQLLSRVFPDETVYSKFLSFEEVKTFHRELKMRLVGLASPQDALAYRDRLEFALDRAYRLEAVSARSVLAARAVRAAIAKDNIALRFSSPSDNPGTTPIVRLWQRKVDGPRWVMEFPLFGSNGRGDPRNQALILERLDRLERASQVAREQARKAYRRIARFPRTPGRLREEDVSALQSLLNPRDVVAREKIEAQRSRFLHSTL